jgi:hypothetical protein
VHRASATTVCERDVRIHEPVLTPPRPFDAFEECGW